MTEEGWYVDPYGRHEARWISDGTPTALVRDGEVEAQDPPPDTPVTGAMERISDPDAAYGGELKRADDRDGGDPRTIKQAGIDAIDSFGPTL